MSPRKSKTTHRPISRAQEAEIADRMDCRVPRAFFWSANQVANWIAKLGFPFYKVTIVELINLFSVQSVLFQTSFS